MNQYGSSPERRIVDAIVEDLRNRRGIGDEWDRIEFDVREEILDVWRAKVKRILDGKRPKKNGPAKMDQSDVAAAISEYCVDTNYNGNNHGSSMDR